MARAATPSETHKNRPMSLRFIAIVPKAFLIALFGMLSISYLFANDGVTPSSHAQKSARWLLSFDAGYLDERGAYAGGSEIMHLASHHGKLFAANGYWMDGRWEIPPDGKKQSAQVLRLDSSDGRWQVDLDTAKGNELGLEFMKGNILKSVTFTQDESGKPLPEAQSLLVMAAGARFDRGGAVSAWVRDDQKGTWLHTLVRHGSAAGGVRWIPRDMQVYRDKVTGVEQLFLLLGNPGVITGVYAPDHPGKIRWSRNTEFPFLKQGTFRTRPLGIVQANGSLFFSVDDAIYRRIDGAVPTWEQVFRLGDNIDTDVGGVRGLTTVANPTGEGESLLFAWAPGGRSTSQIMRLDPNPAGGYTRHSEVSILELMSKRLNVRVSYTLAAHNMMHPVKHPTTGETVHLIGFQGNIHGKDHLRWSGSALYGGAMYAIRHHDGSYSLHEVNNSFHQGRPPLVTPRSFCLSPFDDGQLFIAGHDSSNRISDDMAWVFKTSLEVGLGQNTATSWTAPPRSSPVDPRLLSGPVYELRTYIAAADRFDHLVERFQKHTDPLFRKHGMEPIGYWSPIDGPPVNKRTFVYILKHPSRYDAWKNWVAFTNDRAWQQVLDQPKFQRLLIGKPNSIFLTNNESIGSLMLEKEMPGRIFELKTFTLPTSQLAGRKAQLKKRTTQLLRNHGVNILACWGDFDSTSESNQLIYLLEHANRQQSNSNWRTLEADEDWQRLIGEIQVSRKQPPEPTHNMLLRAFEFSRLR